MNVKEHLRELRRRGALLRVDGNRLFLDAPEDALTEEEWGHLAGHKGEIIALTTGPVRSVLAFHPPGSVPPLPAPIGIEYEPGADWQPGEEPLVDLVYREGETPAWCTSCGAELVNQHHSLCGPCRWERAKKCRWEPVYFDD